MSLRHAAPWASRFVAVLFAVTIAAALGAGYSVTEQGLDQPPQCRYDDVVTPHTDYSDWHRTLVDTIYRLPENYVPPDLALVADAGLDGRGKIRAVAVDDLRALVAAAREEGHKLVSWSAYRSYGYQQSTFAAWVERLGKERALAVSARPGHSEHQLGTAIDFGTHGGPAPWDVDDWAATPEGAWMAEHAWRFGFVMSYPRSRRDVVCYDYEPWHFRYVGRDAARLIRDQSVTLREWLWLQQ